MLGFGLGFLYPAQRNVVALLIPGGLESRVMGQRRRGVRDVSTVLVHSTGRERAPSATAMRQSRKHTTNPFSCRRLVSRSRSLRREPRNAPHPGVYQCMGAVLTWLPPLAFSVLRVTGVE